MAATQVGDLCIDDDNITTFSRRKKKKSAVKSVADAALKATGASPSSPYHAPPQMDATRLYLSEIGNAKLLTAEEEVYFSRLAQKGIFPPARG